MKNLTWDWSLVLNLCAGDEWLTCILLQNDEYGHAHLIYYGSSFLSLCKLKYSSIEKQALLLLFGCTEYKDYLLTSNHLVTIQSLQEGLWALINESHLEDCVASFLAKLQQFDLVFKFEKEQYSCQVDLLLKFGKWRRENEGELCDEAEVALRSYIWTLCVRRGSRADGWV